MGADGVRFFQLFLEPVSKEVNTSSLYHSIPSQLYHYSGGRGRRGPVFPVGG